MTAPVLVDVVHPKLKPADDRDLHARHPAPLAGDSIFARTTGYLKNFTWTSATR